MEERKGYVTVEAAVLLPLTSVILLLQIYLCSFLYQGCFLVQTGYAAALRGSRYPQRGEAYVQEQLEELQKGAVLSFGQEQRQVEVNGLWVKVHLQRDTPLLGKAGDRLLLTADWKLAVRNPVAYIRGIQKWEEIRARHE